MTVFCLHKEETVVLLFLAPNSPIPSRSAVSSPFLSHSHKSPIAAISHQLRARGVVLENWAQNNSRSSMLLWLLLLLTVAHTYTRLYSSQDCNEAATENL